MVRSRILDKNNQIPVTQTCRTQSQQYPSEIRAYLARLRHLLRARRILKSERINTRSVVSIVQEIIVSRDLKIGAMDSSLKRDKIQLMYNTRNQWAWISSHHIKTRKQIKDNRKVAKICHLWMLVHGHPFKLLIKRKPIRRWFRPVRHFPSLHPPN